MKNFKNFNSINWELWDKHIDYAGKHSIFITDKEHVKNWLNYELPEGCGVRVFRHKNWQGTSFDVVAVIQNIMWINGMAPRVRACMEFTDTRNSFWVHIVEELKEESLFSKELNDRLLEVARNNFIIPYEGVHEETEYNNCNWRNGKYVDYGGWKFENEEAYKQKLIDKIVDVTHFGKAYNGGRASYQSIPEWKLDGKRKTDYRINILRLDQIDFTNKSVLDIGCNLGMMLHYAKARGASKLTGYDLSDVVAVAREFANYKKEFGFDFYAQELTKEPPKEEADIVFFLAMSEYLGFPKWLPKITKEICLYEGHANEDSNKTERELRKLFKKVVYLGSSDDRSIRPLFACSNNYNIL